MFHDAVLGTVGRECKQSPGRELIIRIPRVLVQVRRKIITKRGPGFTAFSLGAGSAAEKSVQAARRFSTRTVGVTASRWTGNYTPSGEPEPTHTWDTDGYTASGYEETQDLSTLLPVTQDIDITSNTQSGNATGTLGDLTNSLSRTGADWWAYPPTLVGSYASATESATTTTRTVTLDGNDYDTTDTNGNRIVSDYQVDITETVSEEFSYANLYTSLNARLAEIEWQSFGATSYRRLVGYDQWVWYRYWSGESLMTQEVDLGASPPGSHDGSESTSDPALNPDIAFTPDGTTDVLHYPATYDGSDGGVTINHLQFRTVNGAAEYGIIERLWFPTLNKYVATVRLNYGVTSPNTPVTAPASTFLAFGVKTITTGGVSHSVEAFAPEIIICFGQTATEWLTTNAATHVTNWT